MTDLKDRTLEERTESGMESIKNLMNDVHVYFNKFERKNFERAIYFQSQVLFEQNQIIIDYLQEIYRGLKK